VDGGVHEFPANSYSAYELAGIELGLSGERSISAP
jgi:hypothetical protein